MNNIKIYGKENCSYCTKAKHLLESYNLNYDYFSLGTDLTVDELLESFPTAKTVPIVVVNDKWIGGFNELENYLEETMSNYGHPI